MNSFSEYAAPEEIERRSFEIIAAELGDIALPREVEAVVKRVIHTTADFEYARTLCFSKGAAAIAMAAFREGCAIVTDTEMARAGINKTACRTLACEAHCYIGDDDVRLAAREDGGTRSRAAVDKAAKLFADGNVVYVVGNAPTALIRLRELLVEGRWRPRLVVGVPVGFVNVVESKEAIMACDIPYIVARGRKGGSNVAAAICNALLYQCLAV